MSTSTTTTETTTTAPFDVTVVSGTVSAEGDAAEIMYASYEEDSAAFEDNYIRAMADSMDGIDESMLSLSEVSWVTPERRLAEPHSAEEEPSDRRLQSGGMLVIGYAITLSEADATSNGIAIDNIDQQIASSAGALTTNLNREFGVSLARIVPSTVSITIKSSNWRDATSTSTTTTTPVNLTSYTPTVVGTVNISMTIMREIDGRTTTEYGDELAKSSKVPYILADGIASAHSGILYASQLTFGKANWTDGAASSGRRLAVGDAVLLTVPFTLFLKSPDFPTAEAALAEFNDGRFKSGFDAYILAHQTLPFVVAGVEFMIDTVSHDAEFAPDLLSSLGITSSTNPPLAVGEGQGPVVAMASAGFTALGKMGTGDWYRSWAGILLWVLVFIHFLVALVVYWNFRNLAALKKKSLTSLSTSYWLWKANLDAAEGSRAKTRIFADRQGKGAWNVVRLEFRRQLLGRFIGVNVGMEEYLAMGFFHSLRTALIARYLQLLVASESSLSENDVGYLVYHCARTQKWALGRDFHKAAEKTLKDKSGKAFSSDQLRKRIAHVDVLCNKLSEAHDLRLKALSEWGRRFRWQVLDFLKAEHPVFRLFQFSLSSQNHVRVLGLWALDFAAYAIATIALATVNRLNGAYGDGTVELSPTSFIRDVLLGVLGRWTAIFLASLRTRGGGSKKSSGQDVKVSGAESGTTLLTMGTLMIGVSFIICAAFLADANSEVRIYVHWVVAIGMQTLISWLVWPVMRAALWASLPFLVRVTPLDVAALSRKPKPKEPIAEDADGRQDHPPPASIDDGHALHTNYSLPSVPPPPTLPHLVPEQQPASQGATPRMPEPPWMPSARPPPRFGSDAEQEAGPQAVTPRLPFEMTQDSEEGSVPLPKPQVPEDALIEKLLRLLDLTRNGELSKAGLEKALRLGQLKFIKLLPVTRSITDSKVREPDTSSLRRTALATRPPPPSRTDLPTFGGSHEELEVGPLVPASLIRFPEPGFPRFGRDDLDLDQESSTRSATRARSSSPSRSRTRSYYGGIGSTGTGASTGQRSDTATGMESLQEQNDTLKDRNRQLQDLIAEARRLKEQASALPPSTTHEEREQLRQARKEVKQRAATLGAQLAVEMSGGRKQQAAATITMPGRGGNGASRSQTDDGARGHGDPDGGRRALAWPGKGRDDDRGIDGALVPARAHRADGSKSKALAPFGGIEETGMAIRSKERIVLETPYDQARAVFSSLDISPGHGMTVQELRFSIDRGMLAPGDLSGKLKAELPSSEDAQKQNKELRAVNERLRSLVFQSRELDRRLLSAVSREERKDLRSQQRVLRDELRKIKSVFSTTLAEVPEDRATSGAESSRSGALVATAQEARRENSDLSDINRKLRTLIEEARDLDQRVAASTSREERRSLRARQRELRDELKRVKAGAMMTISEDDGELNFSLPSIPSSSRTGSQLMLTSPDSGALSSQRSRPIPKRPPVAEPNATELPLAVPEQRRSSPKRPASTSGSSQSPTRETGAVASRKTLAPRSPKQRAQERVQDRSRSPPVKTPPTGRSTEEGPALSVANKELRSHNKNLKHFLDEAREISRKLADESTSREEKKELRAARRLLQQKVAALRSAGAMLMDHGSERGGDSEMTGVSSVDGLVPAKRPVGDASRLPDDAVSTTAASQSASSTGLSPSKKRARRPSGTSLGVVGEDAMSVTANSP